MPKALIARIAQGIVVLGFGLSVFAQVAEAKAPVVSIATTVERGSFVSISAGTKWKSKPVVVEVGVKSKKTWKWSRVASSRTDKSGKTTMCSSRTLNAGTQLRVKSGAKVISTIKISRTIALSGCGYVPPVAPASTVAPLGAGPTPTTPGATTPSQSVSTTVPPTTVPPTTTPATTVPPTTVPPTTVPPTTVPPTTVPPTTVPPTTVPPTTVPPSTTTTVPAPTAAPTALALSAATDTGDSQSDGITKADTLVVVGNAEASSSVQIFVDGASSGSACTANGSGAFSCTLGTVPAGTKAVTAKATGANGESVASQALTIIVDRTKPTVQWSPNGNLWRGANENTLLTFVISEVTTTLNIQDVRMICSMVGGCALSNFSGSETSYSVVFSTIDNFADGGFVGLFANSFTDVAGNFNDASSGATIMYDTVGPRPTLSTENGFIIITFSEVPTNFTKSSLSISYYYGNQKASGLGAGSGINNFAAHGTSGKSWRFIVNDLYSNYRDDTYGEYYLLEVASVTDVDGNSTYPEELNWP